MPYIFDLTCYRYEFEKSKLLEDIQFIKLTQFNKTIIYRMGLS